MFLNNNLLDVIQKQTLKNSFLNKAMSKKYLCIYVKLRGK